MSTSFQNLGLSAELLRAVAEQGYTEPTPIQSQAIPVVLAGRDLLAAAQTGTGKTAGFTLPMLQRLAAAGARPGPRPVRALVLVPTRELAAQVQQSVRDYGRHLALESVVIFGGVGFNPQADNLADGVDIVVATPGRLLDHVHEKTIDLGRIEILVLDEADRMLDMGFIPDIRRILALLPAKRQNLLFSATFPDEIRKLASSFMRDPATVEVARRNAPIELITQVAHPVDRERKRALLEHLIKSNDWTQVLVFTKTKHGANRLAQQLGRAKIEADAIHGNKAQNARTRALKAFKDNELRVLVATDIAARGLDIELLPHVVNYDLPNVPEDYVHRIGRTGRAGETGEAISLVTPEDRPLLAAIERLIHRKIESRAVPGFEPGSAPPAHEREQQQQQQQQQQQGRGRGERRHRDQPRRNPPHRNQPRHAAANPGNGGRPPQHNRQDPRNANRGQGRPQGPRGPGAPGRPGAPARPGGRGGPPRPDEQERLAQIEYARRMKLAEEQAGSEPAQPAGNGQSAQQPSAPNPGPRRDRAPQTPALFNTFGRKNGG
ncbi:MAG TPA: DEAD/DEAH box helicase [Burkholderiales bacterium]|nr:DEAD/DEAH box helicase [Burkholderiales bacterium]